jgi:hypothetical protein
MNTGRFVGASVAVFVVRFLLNGAFYGYAMKGRYDELSAAHPGLFRNVIAGFALLDLLSAILIAYLIVKAGSAFGGGLKGGVTLAILIAILCPILGGLYFFFTVTWYPADLFTIEAVYQLVSHAVQGAIAAAIYKSA